ncbi:DUF3307 domain-containing protein [Salinimicrobium sp. TH3]|uniref:DUF3307 domain-containing protein n=1 Tax=Salinimicrobium sp. TH3 TaxID=2997342 RepID=UPI002276D708|nr:DUF3307 domain-containing protein [Salinimicrobium sp. TH3]MCY2687653.1 DUF3307 domain-containing protein [Salinimicrobium sp. TH3]
MTALALKLLLAHMLGDFLLQPDGWVAQKRHKKYRSPLLYLHIFVHAAAMLLLLNFDLNFWIGIVVILVTHYLIDLLKLTLETNANRGKLFVLDQLAHLLVIMGVVYSYYPFQIQWTGFFVSAIVLFLICLVFLGPVSAIIMRLLMNRWELPEDSEEDSLPQAGKYIGMLERFLVFGFIVLQQWQAIGWLIAAKSILRFSDLSRAKDRKLTEYVLIGTLLSFLMAIITGMLYLYINQKI